jgi:hypothetical protein
VKIREILDLVASSAAEPDKRVEKIFDWRHARLLETAKWALGLSAALAVALVVSMAKAELHTGRVVQGFLFGVIVCFAMVGVIALMRCGRLQRDYAAALGLVARISTFRELIRRYRHM